MNSEQTVAEVARLVGCTGRLSDVMQRATSTLQAVHCSESRAASSATLMLAHLEQADQIFGEMQRSPRLDSEQLQDWAEGNMAAAAALKASAMLCITSYITAHAGTSLYNVFFNLFACDCTVCLRGLQKTSAAAGGK